MARYLLCRTIGTSQVNSDEKSNMCILSFFSRCYVLFPFATHEQRRRMKKKKISLFFATAFESVLDFADVVSSMED